jgi:hypothetical protein
MKGGAMGSFKYQVVAFVGNIKAGSRDSSQTVSAQLQTVIDSYVQQGWDFYSVEKIGIRVQPGCISGLFGAQVAYVNFDQIIFRRTA